MNIDIAIATTARQDKKLAKVLASVNAARAAEGKNPFTDIPDYLTWLLNQAIKDFTKRQDDVDSGVIAAAYDAATEATQLQVETILGVV